MGFRVIEAERGPKPLAHYSQAIRAGDLLFTAGQTPRHPITGEIPTAIEDQVSQVLENLKTLLEAAGTSMKYVARVTVYLRDDNDFDAMDAVFQRYFTEGPPPTRTTIQAGIGMIGIEIDAIAWIPPEVPDERV